MHAFERLRVSGAHTSVHRRECACRAFNVRVCGLETPLMRSTRRGRIEIRHTCVDSEVVYQLVFGFEGLQFARTLLPEARVVRLAERRGQTSVVIMLIMIYE